jgi:hypothetical protein
MEKLWQKTTFVSSRLYPSLRGPVGDSFEVGSLRHQMNRHDHNILLLSDLTEYRCKSAHHNTGCPKILEPMGILILFSHFYLQVKDKG